MELPHACDGMRTILETEESALTYDPSWRMYSIAYLSDGSVHEIDYCPFCGTKLPDSLPEQWLARVEALGLELGSDDIPEELRDDRWWRAAGL